MFKRISNGLLVIFIMIAILVVGVFAAEGPRQKHYYSIDVNKSEEEVLANASPNNKTRAAVTEKGRQAVYFFINSEKNRELDSFVEDFVPDKSTDVAKIKSVVKFIKDKELKYSERTEYNLDHQFENMTDGHTMCLGITMLGSKLLDKADMEYRYVLKRKKIKDTISINGVSGGHIALEAKTDKGNWMELDLTRVICSKTNADFGMIFEMEVKATDKKGEKEVYNRSITRSLENPTENEYLEFVVSPSYKNGEMIDNKLQLFTN